MLSVLSGVFSPCDSLSLYRARAYLKLRSFDKALIDAEQCTELNPSFSRAWRYLGEANSGLGHREAATKAFGRCLSLDSTDDTARQALKNSDSETVTASASMSETASDASSRPSLISTPLVVEVPDSESDAVPAGPGSLSPLSPSESVKGPAGVTGDDWVQV